MIRFGQETHNTEFFLSPSFPFKDLVYSFIYVFDSEKVHSKQEAEGEGEQTPR